MTLRVGAYKSETTLDFFTPLDSSPGRHPVIHPPQVLPAPDLADNRHPQTSPANLNCRLAWLSSTFRQITSSHPAIPCLAHAVSLGFLTLANTGHSPPHHSLVLAPGGVF